MADGIAARLVRGVWRARCGNDWAAMVPADHDELMAAQFGDRFHAKQGRSIARWTLDRNDRRLVVYLKRHFHGSRWAGWLATFLPEGNWTAAGREAAHLHWAAANGFRVPRVVAWGERIGPWGRSQSYLALEELTGMIALHEAIPAAAHRMSAWTFQNWKRGLIGALANIVARLHRLRHYHKDLYLCHFFIPERLTHEAPADWNSNLAMIDLHRLGHHSYSAAWWRLKDLAQLLYSSDIVGITARDRLRFARHYAGSSRKSIGWRLTRWAVGIRWRNYQRHNAERKFNRAA